MKSELLLHGLINMLLLSFIVEGAVSAVFSITALRSVETKRVVQTTREVLIFLVSLLFVYSIESLKLFKAAGINFPAIGDMIVSTLVLTRIAGFIRDLMTRIRTGA